MEDIWKKKSKNVSRTNGYRMQSKVTGAAIQHSASQQHFLIVTGENAGTSKEAYS